MFFGSLLQLIFVRPSVLFHCCLSYFILHHQLRLMGFVSSPSTGPFTDFYSVLSEPVFWQPFVLLSNRRAFVVFGVAIISSCYMILCTLSIHLCVRVSVCVCVYINRFLMPERGQF